MASLTYVLKEPFVMKLQVEHKPSNGIHISEVAKLWLRILNIQSSINSQTMKMWKKCVNWSVRTGGIWL